MVKSLLTMLETWVQSLGWEDPLEEEMATHSSILACEIPWTEETGGLSSVELQESDTTYQLNRASLVVQRLKRLPAMWETRVRSLGREDPVEKKMATHSSILAWRIPWTEELGGLQSMGCRVRHD